MPIRHPGTTCGDKLGQGWIDPGTLALTRSHPPCTVGSENSSYQRAVTVPVDTPTRLLRAAQAGLSKLPQEAREKVTALLTVEAMAIIAGSIIVLAGAHAIGIGFAIDVIMLGLSVAFLGKEVFEVGRHFQRFYDLALGAQTEEDYANAGEEFARAVAIIGVDATIALLARSGTRGRGSVSATSAKNGALLQSWISRVSATKFTVPRDKGILWSKVGGFRGAEKLAVKKDLTSLEKILKENGFYELYSKQFGSFENIKKEGLEGVTQKIWQEISRRYANALEGKVTAFVHNRTLGSAIRNNKEPVMVDELEEIAEVMVNNLKITKVEMVDVESGMSRIMVRSEVLKAAWSKISH